MTPRKLLEFGGYSAAAILVAFGIGALAMGIAGRSEVRNDIKREQVVGTADMNKTLIREEAKSAGLPASVELPSCNVANKPITTGAEAKCFAAYMRIHTLEATGGKTYAQMGRYLTPSGKDTNNAALAAKDAKTGQPIENGARNIWVTDLAIATALNTSFFAEQVALFSMIIGIALLLIGLGLGILALVSLRWLPRRGKTVATGTFTGRATAQQT